MTRAADWHRRSFEAAMAQLLDAYPDPERLTPHGLRHTAASLAISAGANVKAVQKMLEHASAAMTLDVDADLFDDDLDADGRRSEPGWRSRSSGQDVGNRWAGREHRDADHPSNRPTQGEKTVGPVGLEPTTRGLKVRCSTD